MNLRWVGSGTHGLHTCVYRAAQASSACGHSWYPRWYRLEVIGARRGSRRSSDCFSETENERTIALDVPGCGFRLGSSRVVPAVAPRPSLESRQHASPPTARRLCEATRSRSGPARPHRPKFLARWAQLPSLANRLDDRLKAAGPLSGAVETNGPMGGERQSRRGERDGSDEKATHEERNCNPQAPRGPERRAVKQHANALDRLGARLDWHAISWSRPPRLADRSRERERVMVSS